MGFDDVLNWLSAHAEQEVGLSIGTNHGNTSLHVAGRLRSVPNGERCTIDARPGRIEIWAVGDASLQLLEGDFTRAEASTDAPGDLLTVYCAGEQHLLFRCG